MILKVAGVCYKGFVNAASWRAVKLFKGKKANPLIMGKDLSECRPEELRVEIDIAKIVVNSFLGVIFTLLIGIIMILYTNQIEEKLAEIFLLSGGLVLASFLYLNIINPNVQYMRECAIALDIVNAEKEKKYE